MDLKYKVGDILKSVHSRNIIVITGLFKGVYFYTRLNGSRRYVAKRQQLDDSFIKLGPNARILYGTSNR